MLAAEALRDMMMDVLYRETSTLGLRMQRVDRYKLPRREVIVESSLGPIRGKEARWKEEVRITPEFEDCRRVAQEKGVPLQQVYEAFRRAAKGIKTP